MSIDLETFESNARTIGGEHRDAINDAKTAARKKAAADKAYHVALAVQIAMAKQEFGATVAETMAKGHSSVVNAKEELDIATAEDRGAMERVRLARDDRSALLSIAGWSRANEAVE